MVILIFDMYRKPVILPHSGHICLSARLERTKRLERGRLIVCTRSARRFFFHFFLYRYIIGNFQKIADLLNRIDDSAVSPRRISPFQVSSVVIKLSLPDDLLFLL